MSDERAPIRLLLVDDSATVHQTLVALLGRRGARRADGRRYEIDLVQVPADGMAALREGAHDCYLIDHRIGEASGVDMIRELRAEGVSVPIIMLTGTGVVENEAAVAGANDFLIKGSFDAATLERAVRYAMGNADALRRVTEVNLSLEEQVDERTRQHVETNARLLVQIAAREKAEAALLRAGTLEALGRMTGQVAHDFNNVLTALFGSLEQLERRLGPEPDPALARPLHVAREAARRGERMMDGLLAFARRRPIAPQRIELNEAVLAAADSLRAAGGAAELRFALPPASPVIEADRDGLERALLNLVTNARDAMAGRPGAAIEIGAAHEADHQVRLTVADNGPGMAPDVLERAFEPLFSTKTDGRGTGLGLSQVYGFIQSSRGTVEIDNRPGDGLAVVMRFPPAAGPGSDAASL